MVNYFEPSKPGILSTLSKQDKILDFTQSNVDYYILDTNYNDFLVGYYCFTRDFGFHLHKIAYILTRSLNFNEKKYKERINKALKNAEVKLPRLIDSRHEHKKCKTNIFY